MAGITLAQAQAHLDAWLAADIAVAQGQSYTIGSRTLHRANSREIRENIMMWETRVAKIMRGGGGMRVRYATV